MKHRSTDFDLAVIGGGPAGCVSALRAARLGLSVALFEPQSDGHDKPCGEGMMASAIDALTALGIDDLRESGRSFESIRYRIPGSEPMSVRLPRPGASLIRPELQLRLDSLLDVEPLVTRFSENAKLARSAGLQRLECASGEVLTRTVAVADGIGGTNASWMRAPSSSNGRFGVRARFTRRAPLDSVEVHMGGSCELYLTPLPGDLVNVAALFDAPPAGARGTSAWLERAFAETPDCARVLGELHTAPSARDLSRRKPLTPASEGVFLVGDAGGSSDPILGCGVTIAVRSGVAAAEAARRLVAGEPSGAPERDYAVLYRKETAARRALAFALRRAAPYPFVLRRIAALGRRFPGTLTPLVRIVSGESTAA